MDDCFDLPLPLPEISTIIAKLVPVDMSKWDINTYYEAVGLDFEEPQQENGDL